jgi:glycosyltransferase involved in cell wall biosynthesis
VVRSEGGGVQAVYGELGRILLIDPGGERGGTERVGETLARESSARFRVTIACLAAGSWPHELADEGIETYVFERARLRRVDRVLSIVVRLVRLIRRERIRVVHANGNSALLYASLAAKLSRAKLVWHLYDPQSGSGTRRQTLVRLLRRARPDYVVFANEACVPSWLSLLDPAPLHTVVFPGVDMEELAGGVEERGRHELGIASEAPIVLLLARLVPNKGHEDLVRAAPGVRRDVPDVRFVLCSAWEDPQGRDVQRLRELRHELGLDDVVVLTGNVSEQLRADLLAATSVLAHAARAEAFGLAILEAMALGKPVVAADSTGARFLLRNGLDGVLVPAGDTHALGEALSDLLRDPARRTQLAAAGRERAASFSNEEMVRRVEAVWSGLLDGNNKDRERDRGPA